MVQQKRGLESIGELSDINMQVYQGLGWSRVDCLQLGMLSMSISRTRILALGELKGKNFQ